LVKLQRPPPLIAIFLPPDVARSSTSVECPRFPVSIAQNNPAAPAPMIMTSQSLLISFPQNQHSYLPENEIIISLGVPKQVEVSSSFIEVRDNGTYRSK
jgi:hypothetical protein